MTFGLHHTVIGARVAYKSIAALTAGRRMLTSRCKHASTVRFSRIAPYSCNDVYTVYHVDSHTDDHTVWPSRTKSQN
ncbi:unnamed protein product [Sphagnum balticum]